MDIGCILTIGETIEDRQKEINFLNKQWLFILLQNYHSIIETNSMKKGG